MRVLPQRRHPQREGLAGPQPEGERRGDSTGAVRRAVPLLRARPDHARHQALCAGDGSMRSRAFDHSDELDLAPEARRALDAAGLSRRAFLKGSGALIAASAPPVVGKWARGLLGACQRPMLRSPLVRSPRRRVRPTREVWLGQGLYTANPTDRGGARRARTVKLVSATPTTPDQGTRRGPVPSHDLTTRACLGRPPRRALVSSLRTRAYRGPARDKGPARQLTADPSRTVTYGALVGGGRSGVALDPSAKRKHPVMTSSASGTAPRPARHGPRTLRVLHKCVPGSCTGYPSAPSVGGPAISVATFVEDVPGS